MLSASKRVLFPLFAVGLLLVWLPVHACAQWYGGADGAFDLHYDGPSHSDDSYSTWHPRNRRQALINEQQAEEAAREQIEAAKKAAELKREREEAKREAAAAAAEARREDLINQANHVFEEGHTAAMSGDYESAITDYRDAMLVWPDGQNSQMADALARAIEDLREVNNDHAFAAGAFRQVTQGAKSYRAPSFNSVLNGSGLGDSNAQNGNGKFNPPSIDMAIASPPPGHQVYQNRQQAASVKPRSPGTTRAYKGWEALQAHDWQLAAAWYEEALARDPTNKSLQGIVKYAKWAAHHAPNPISRSNGGAGVYKPGTPAPNAEMLQLINQWAKSNPNFIPPGRSNRIPVSTKAAMQSQ